MSGIKPPFTAETALQKTKAAQNLWNTKDPAKVALAYTVSSCVSFGLQFARALTHKFRYGMAWAIHLLNVHLFNVCIAYMQNSRLRNLL